MVMNWAKSSYSSQTGGNCVEIARGQPGTVTVRDSHDPAGPVLRFTTSEWKQLTDRIKAGPRPRDLTRRASR
jgi:uncharacterized protein DUF397